MRRILARTKHDLIDTRMRNSQNLKFIIMFKPVKAMNPKFRIGFCLRLIYKRPSLPILLAKYPPRIKEVVALPNSTTPILLYIIWILLDSKFLIILRVQFLRSLWCYEIENQFLSIFVSGLNIMNIINQVLGYHGSGSIHASICEFVVTITNWAFLMIIVNLIKWKGYRRT